MRTTPVICAALVLALSMTITASTPAGSRAGGAGQAHPWHALLERLPDVGDAPLVLTDEAAVRSAVGADGDGEARERLLGVPAPEHPFAEVARLQPDLDLDPVIGFDLDDVEASVTIEGWGTAYRLSATPTAEQLTERGWRVTRTPRGIVAEPDMVDVPGASRPVTRALSHPMAVSGGVALVGEELTTPLASGALPRTSSTGHRKGLGPVLGHVAAQGAEAAVVVFDGYRPQRPFAPEWLEHYPVGAVAAAGSPGARRLLVVLWHDRTDAAHTNQRRLAHWLEWFADNSSNVEEPVRVEREGRVVHGTVATTDPDVLTTLHRHRALPIGTESPRR